MNKIDGREFRNCCGRFATGITIVTTELEGKIHGMTANGFMSVSMEPPLITISVGHKTRMHPILSQSMRYGVSVLAEEMMNLSNHFAGRPDEGMVIPWVRQNEMPLIDGALAHFVTHVVDAHDAGDHTLFIGEVDYLAYGEGRPLLFYSGGYQQLQKQVAS